MKNRLASIISCSFGNIIEWYDFGLFTIFSTLFSRLFFPVKDTHTALIATFGIFSIGFFCRPLGAMIFGYLGDKFGRASTLRLSILMISIPTLLIGCLPTYHQVGILAPILLTLIRMWQGISIGGEYSGNMIYLAETAPIQYRATFTSLASMGANIGVLLAAFVGMITSQLFTNADLESWGWRIPYLVTGIFCLILYKFRLRIQETQVFEYLKAKNELAKNPIKFVFKDNTAQLLRTFGLVCMGSTFYYFCFIYLPVFFTQHLHFSIHYISILMSLLIGLMILLVPFAGWICDKMGRRKMLLFNSALITLTIVPGYYLLQYNYFILFVMVLLLFTVASSLEQGTTSVAVVENFPPPARYTGLSLGYNIGNGLLGGTVPFICEWLIYKTSYSLAPAIYVAMFAAITYLVVVWFVPETKRINLAEIDTL